MNMERFFFLFSKLLFNSVEIVLDRRMVIVTIPRGKGRRWACKMTGKGNALCKHSLPAYVVSRGDETIRRISDSCCRESIKRLIPIAVAIRIFATHPSDEITVAMH
jgi:hypothetical protein